MGLRKVTILAMDKRTARWRWLQYSSREASKWVKCWIRTRAAGIPHTGLGMRSVVQAIERCFELSVLDAQYWKG